MVLDWNGGQNNINTHKPSECKHKLNDILDENSIKKDVPKWILMGYFSGEWICVVTVDKYKMEHLPLMLHWPDLAQPETSSAYHIKTTYTAI